MTTNWSARKPRRDEYVRPVQPPHPVFIELRKLREKDVFVSHCTVAELTHPVSQHVAGPLL